MFDDSLNVEDHISLAVTSADGITTSSYEQDSIALNGSLNMNVHIEVYDKVTGEVKATRDIHNTVTAAGKNMVIDRLLASPALGVPTHMAVGSGSPATNALGAEIARVALTSKTRSGAVLTMVGDYTAGVATGALTEAGIFDANTSGNMHLSASFAAVTITSLDGVSVTWTLTAT